MKLYEVNQRIADLCEQLEIGCDPETGEVLDNTENVYAELLSLEERRQDILEWLAKLVLNTRADCAALKAEEKRLKDRRIALERKESRLMQILDRECGGKKTDLGVATVNYRKTSSVDVTDSQAAAEWLKAHGHPECYRTPAPEIAKTEVKKLINAGTKVPGCSLNEGVSCSLK